MPLAPYLAAFCIGICVAISGVEAHLAGWITLASWIAAVAAVVFRWHRTAAILIALTAIALGFFRYQAADERSLSAGDPPPGIPDGPQVYEGIVSSYVETSDKASRFDVRLTGWMEEGIFRPLPWSARLTAVTDDLPVRGDTIRFRANLHAPRNFGNDREFDFEAYSRARGIDLIGSIVGRDRWARVSSPDSKLRRWLNRLRSTAYERAELFMEVRHAALYRSLVLGDRAGVDAHMMEIFRRSGILHLMVVSGSNVAMVALWGGFLFGWLWRRLARLAARFPVYYAHAAGGAFAASMFCALVDLPVPTVRALMVVLLAAFGMSVGRERDPWSLLAFVALVILAWRPLFLFDVSFQLTFVAVAGIVAAIEALPPPKSWRKLLRIFWGLFIMSMGAFLLTMPVLLYHFGRISLVAPLGNLLFVPPLGGIVSPLGLIATITGGPVGDFLFCVMDVWLGIWVTWLEYFSRLPWTDLWWPPFPAACYVSYVVGLFLARYWRTPMMRPSLKFATVIAAAVPFFEFELRPLPSEHRLHFLHVGQGDAIFLATAERNSILIDTGPASPTGFDAGSRIIVPWLRSHGFTELDLLVLSHGDIDHVGGAKAILGEVRVREVWYSRGSPPPNIEDLRRVAPYGPTIWKEVTSDTPIRKIGDIQLTPLHPPRSQSGALAHPNDQSIVLLAQIGGIRALLTGDVERPAEARLLADGFRLDADVLKVAHHGSRTSSTSPFVAAVSPRFSVVTAGYRNHYHHPYAAVIDRLRRSGSHLLRGDLCGEIRFRIGPEEMSVGTVRSCTNHL